MILAQFTINCRLPGLNDYINANRGNRYGGASIKKQVEEYICWELKQQKVKPVNTVASVAFHWVEPNRARDFDNIAFAKKFIFDALQAAGILAGDGWKHLRGFTDSFGVDKDRPRVEVTIIKAEDEIRGEQGRLM